MISPQLKRSLPAYACLLVVPLIWIGLWRGGALQALENGSIDHRFHLRGPLDAPVKVLYVDIDSQAVLELGNFPWSHGLYARVCSALIEQGGARAVGVDVVMSEAAVPRVVDRKVWAAEHQKLWDYLSKSPPVVMAASYAAQVRRGPQGELLNQELPLLRDGKEVGEMPELPQWRMGGVVLSPAVVGLIDTLDGGMRTVPMFARTEGRTFLHMSVELARLYWGLPNDAVTITKEAIELRDAQGGLVRRIPLRAGQLHDVNWFSPWEDRARNPRVSFADVEAFAYALESSSGEDRGLARDFFAQDEFKDAIVLIGAVDPLLQDLAPTSLDPLPVPRVGVHGSLVKAIMSERFLRYPDAWQENAIVFGLAVAVTYLIVLAAGLWARVLAALLVGGYVVGSYYLFARGDWVLPLVAPVGASVSMGFLGVAWRLIVEEKQKRRIKGMFGTYVSPKLVDRMVSSGESPKLGGAVEEITAYFSDIQHFTTLAEHLSPTQLVEWMNGYLTACTDILHSEGGTLDKYVGDGVIAMYGAPVSMPDHAYRACVSALRVQRRLAELRRQWSEEGDKWPLAVRNVHTRIGLNTGYAVVGNMGSSTRFNYTMMGDDVNLASRMEGAARIYGVPVMATESTKRACERQAGPGCLVFRQLDRITVVGRSQPVPVYQVVGLPDDVTSDTRGCIEQFERGLELYWSCDWSGAIRAFRRSSILEPALVPGEGGTVSNPSLMMIRRCELLWENPPDADWDGVYDLTTK